MKSGVSLQQMLTEVKRQSESKEDYLIAPNRLRMESYGKEMFLHLSDDSGTELIEPMTITGIAHRQIGTHLRIPAAYYDRMREERPDLLAYNANTWFKQESSQRMLRTLDGSARAYLSNRYRRIDNIDIAGVTLPILGGLPDIRFESCQITESRMYIDISELSGDLLTVGMYIGLDYMWDKAKEDLTRRKQIFIDEVWQIIGASSNALAANYVFEAVKTIRGYGGGVLVATQDLNDFFSLEDGKYGRGILNNCKIKIILNLEEEEAQRVQSVLKLTDTEIDNITRFERGSALIVTNSNNVTVDMRCSEEEKDLITTDRDELRRIVERKMQNQTETEES